MSEDVADQSGANDCDQNSKPGHAVRTESSALDRQFDNQAIRLAVLGSDRRPQKLHWPHPPPNAVGGVDLTAFYSFYPLRCTVSGKIVPLLIEEKGVDVLGLAEGPQITAKPFRTPGLVCLHGLRTNFCCRASIPAASRGGRDAECHQNSRYEEKRECQPVQRKILRKRLLI